MARKQVVEIQCDRCTRVENRTEDVPDPSTEHKKAFEASFDGSQKVSFDDLCTPCRTTVRQHLEAIAKKLEGMSPDRSKSKEEKKATPPVVDATTDAKAIQAHIDTASAEYAKQKDKELASKNAPTPSPKTMPGTGTGSGRRGSEER